MTNGHPVGPDFIRDPSGCTAVAALITEDDRIFVVRKLAFYPYFVAVTDFPLSDLLAAFVGRVLITSIGQRRRFEMRPGYQG